MRIKSIIFAKLRVLEYIISMLKIWAKTYNGDKIIKSKVVEFSTTRMLFYDMVKEVCQQMDIATPVVLNAHYDDMVHFRNCIFRQVDFVDAINFDRLQLEMMRD